ncbi:MAG: FAD-dependent oxidoreductase [Candidatus Omnitrophota bacterium]|nr:FAD-dependent oxidoreductase [Candidatus Omnitrophota bacterium]
MEKKKNILILGAGPAGLSAGWKLAEKGFAVKVLEKEPYVGGQCATIERDKYRFDLGGHRFITTDKKLLREINGLMEGELIPTSRKSQIRLFNKYFDYPLEIKSLAKGVNPFFSAWCLLDYAYSVTRKRLFNPVESSFEDWVVNRFGRPLYRVFFGMYTRKLWGTSPKLISSDWAAQRISLINLTDVILRLLGKKSNAPKTYALNFLYPKLGIGRIVERLCEEIRCNRGELLVDSEVIKITHEEGNIKSILFQGPEGVKEISADFYVNTIPLPEFIHKLSPAAGEKYLHASRQIKFRSVRFMNIIFDQQRISPNTWIYVPEPEYVFFRIQETKNWSSYLVPDENRTALILEVACFEGDELWNKTDEELFQICLSDLKKLGLIDDSAKAVRFFSSRLKNAYPIYGLGYQKEIECCLELIKGMSNLISIGRQGLFRYNNMDHSVKMGMLAAEHIEHGNLEAKIFSIASEKEAFESERDRQDRE